MAFPQITYKKNNLDISEELLTVLESKLTSLEKFIGDASVVCDVEFEKVAEKKQGAVHRLEVNLLVDGQMYRAEATMENFESAIDEVRDELDKLLRRAIRKKDTLFKKGARKMKHWLRFGR